MNAGKIFEKDFKDSIPESVYYKKLQDAAIGFNIETSQQRFAPKSPYDFILYQYPNMWCLELKSTEGTSISFNGKTPMIRPHQRKELMEAHEKRCIAGFVMNFRKVEQTYFVPIDTFEKFAESTTKKSINPGDIMKLMDGLPRQPFCIQQQKKQVHYRYAVDRFLEVTGMEY